MTKMYACIGVLLAIYLGSFPAQSQNSWDLVSVDSECPGMINIDEADCLRGRIENEDETVTGYGDAYDSWFYVESRCYEYGNVKAQARFDSLTTPVVTTRSNVSLIYPYIELGFYNAGKHVEELGCCPEVGFICNESQVKANDNGQITHLSTSEGELVSEQVDMSTHTLRYRFCQNNPEDVYCVNNLTGDASTQPTCAGDSTWCNDCNDQWELSSLSENCTSKNMEYTESISEDNWKTCSFSAVCRNVTFNNQSWPLNDLPNLVNCVSNRRRTITNDADNCDD